MKKAVQLSISSCWIACSYCDAALKSALASQSANQAPAVGVIGGLLSQSIALVYQVLASKCGSQEGVRRGAR